MIYFSYFHLYFALAIFSIILIILSKQKRSFWYLFFFSLFWFYILYVVSVVVFPISPLDKANWEAFLPRINVIPFYFGVCDIPILCLRDVLGNILLTLPFGFGISFIMQLKSKDFLLLAILVGFLLETLQLIVSLMFRSAFRAVDINDVILNATGVLLGYGFFRIFGWLYIFVMHKFAINKKYVFAFIYDGVRQSL